MVTKQTILITGSGKTGRLITGLIAKAQHKLLLCDENFELAQRLAKDITNADQRYDAEALECSFNCAWEADIILLAIAAFDEQIAIATKIKNVVNQKILISVADDAFSTAGNSKGEIYQQLIALQQLLPYTNVVLLQHSNNHDDTTTTSLAKTDIIVTGSDADTLQAVASLFDNVDAIRFKQNLLATYSR